MVETLLFQKQQLVQQFTLPQHKLYVFVLMKLGDFLSLLGLRYKIRNESQFVAFFSHLLQY
jgi:hypothetical protein